MISHNMLAFERQHGRAPFLQLRVDGGLEFLVVRLVESGVRWIESGKRLCNVLRNRFGDDRVSREMWITERVHVTGGACDICGHVHEANSLRSLNAPRFADLDFWIARVLQKRRQPAELKLRATVDQNIGIAQRNNETRARVDEVRVF